LCEDERPITSSVKAVVERRSDSSTGSICARPVSEELLSEGGRDLSPDGRTFLRRLLVTTEEAAKQTKDPSYGALLLYRCWRCYDPLLFSDGVIGVGLDCAGSHKTRDESVTNIHYVCEEKIVNLSNGRLIGL
jgi:hypothetical protein